jgi:MATE family multidrug resistance protein
MKLFKWKRKKQYNNNNNDIYYYQSIQETHTTSTTNSTSSTNLNIAEEEKNVPTKNSSSSPDSSPNSSTSKSTSSTTSFSTFNLSHEFNLLCQIALPTIGVQFFTNLIFPITASYVGKHDMNNNHSHPNNDPNIDSNNNPNNNDNLAAFSLATLSSNLSCISIIIGTLSASETLQPRAFSLKQYDEVGILAIRGFVMCIITLSIPILVLLCYMDDIFELLLGFNVDNSIGNGNDNDHGNGIGHDNDDNDDDGYTIMNLSTKWIHIYIWSIPFILLFRILQRFLAAQNVVFPCMVGSFISHVILHPILLKYWIYYFDFQGSALSIVFTKFLQLVITLGYIILHEYYRNRKNKKKRNGGTSNNVGGGSSTVDGSSSSADGSSHGSSSNHQNDLYVKETWNYNTISKLCNIQTLQKVFNYHAFTTYAKLSMGGIFSLSEWWYWESICFIVGKLGVVSLCVHTVSYQIIPLLYMIPLGISIGLSVRIGQLLPYDVHKAKILAFYTMICVICIAILVTYLLYVNQYWIVSMFTSDEDVIHGCDAIWYILCKYILGLYVFCLNSGILRALGLQWKMGLIVIVVLWFFSLPCIIYFGIIDNNNGHDVGGNNGDNDIDYTGNESGSGSASTSTEEGIEGLVTIWNILFWSYIVLNIGLTSCYVMADWHEIGRKAALSRESSLSLSQQQSSKSQLISPKSLVSSPSTHPSSHPLVPTQPSSSSLSSSVVLSTQQIQKEENIDDFDAGIDSNNNNNNNEDDNDDLSYGESDDNDTDKDGETTICEESSLISYGSRTTLLTSNLPKRRKK